MSLILVFYFDLYWFYITWNLYSGLFFTNASLLCTISGLWMLLTFSMSFVPGKRLPS